MLLRTVSHGVIIPERACHSRFSPIGLRTGLARNGRIVDQRRTTANTNARSAWTASPRSTTGADTRKACIYHSNRGSAHQNSQIPCKPKMMIIHHHASSAASRHPHHLTLKPTNLTPAQQDPNPSAPSVGKTISDSICANSTTAQESLTWTCAAVSRTTCGANAGSVAWFWRHGQRGRIIWRNISRGVRGWRSGLEMVGDWSLQC